MNWVEDFAWLLILGGVLVFLLATYFGGVLHGRRAAAREDERQRALALAIEEERRSEDEVDRALRRQEWQRYGRCNCCAPIEVDGPTDRPYLRSEWT